MSAQIIPLSPKHGVTDDGDQGHLGRHNLREVARSPSSESLSLVKHAEGVVQTLADWVYGYVTQKRALTLIPGYHPRYPDTQVPPLSITEVERAESRTPIQTSQRPTRVRAGFESK